MPGAASDWRLTRRLKAVLATDDDWIALGYGAFLLGALLRCTWLVLDLASSEALGALMMLLAIPLVLLVFATMAVTPLADLAGALAAFRRPREARLWLMAIATACFWGRGYLSPELCGTGPGHSVWVTQFCEQAARGALGIVLLGLCLDRMLFSRCLPVWLRLAAIAMAVTWVNISLGGGDHLSSALDALESALGRTEGTPFERVAEPLREMRALAARVAWGLLAILAAVLAASLRKRRPSSPGDAP